MRHGAFSMTIDQLCRLCLPTLTATPRIVTKASALLGGVKITTKNATVTGALLHLEFLRLYVGRQVHTLPRYEMYRTPAGAACSCGYTDTSQRRTLGLTKKHVILGLAGARSRGSSP